MATAAMALVVGVGEIGPASAAVGQVAVDEQVCTAAGDPVPITADVVLTSDVDCGSAVLDFDAAATIDLAGFRLSAGGVESVAPSLDVVDATVRNGALALDDGVDSAFADGNLTGRLHLEGVQGSGRIVSSSAQSSASDGLLDITQSTWVGSIRAVQEGIGITGSFVLGSVEIDGTTAGAELHNNTIQGPVTLLDQRAALVVSVTDNVVYASDGAGIALHASQFATGHITGEISRNWALFNAGAGIAADGWLLTIGQLSFSSNIAMLNAGDGIAITSDVDYGGVVAGSGPVTVANNGTLLNQGHGIDASWVAGQPTAIVDGGANVSLWDVLSPGCLGVVC